MYRFIKRRRSDALAPIIECRWLVSRGGYPLIAEPTKPTNAEINNGSPWTAKFERHLLGAAGEWTDATLELARATTTKWRSVWMRKRPPLSAYCSRVALSRSFRSLAKGTWRLA